LTHVYCGQTAGWIKIPLGTEVNVGPGDVVLDGIAAPSCRGPCKKKVFAYRELTAGVAEWLVSAVVAIYEGPQTVISRRR